MDAFTLNMATTIASLIMAASLYALYRASPRELSLLDWTLAGVFFLLSNCIGLLSLSWPIPFWAAPALINGLYIAGHGAILIGVRRHLRLSPGWPRLSGLAVFAVALHVLPFVRESVANRLLLFYPMIIALDLAVLMSLWKARRSEMGYVYWPLIGAEAFFVLQMLLRGVWLLVAGSEGLTFGGNQFLQTSGTLAILVFLVVVNMGCALIVIRNQELALRRSAITDSLTGWLNRHALQEISARAFVRTAGQQHEMAFIMLDIDHFKAINDRHGHGGGDHALRHVVRIATGALRDHDVGFRIGGEEFAVLVVDTPPTEVEHLAEQLRRAIESAPCRLPTGMVQLTVSLGVAYRRTNDGNWDAVLRRADETLYRSKREGRNRVSVDLPVLPAATAPVS